MILPGFPKVMVAGGKSVEFIGAEQARATGTSTANVSIPSGTQNGDFLIAVLTTPNVGPDPVVPSGWTLIYSDPAVDGRSHFMTKVAASEGSSVSFGTVTTATKRVVLYSFRNANEIGDMEISTDFNNTITVPSINVSAGSITIFHIMLIGSPITVTTPPSGMTPVISASEASPSMAGFSGEFSGATGSKTATTSSYTNIRAFLFEVKP